MFVHMHVHVATVCIRTCSRSIAIVKHKDSKRYVPIWDLRGYSYIYVYMYVNAHVRVFAVATMALPAGTSYM